MGRQIDVAQKFTNLPRTKVYVLSDSVLSLGKIHENLQPNAAWEPRLEWFKTSLEYRNFNRIDGEPIEFEWNIFPGFTTLQLSHKVQELLSRLSAEPEKIIGRIIFMSMFNDISWGSRDNKKECESNAQSRFSLCKKNLEQDYGHFSGLVQRKSGIPSVKIVHKVNGTKWQRR